MPISQAFTKNAFGQKAEGIFINALTLSILDRDIDYLNAFCANS